MVDSGDVAGVLSRHWRAPQARHMRYKRAAPGLVCGPASPGPAFSTPQHKAGAGRALAGWIRVMDRMRKRVREWVACGDRVSLEMMRVGWTRSEKSETVPTTDYTGWRADVQLSARSRTHEEFG
jgi:hypothetical protein